MIRENILRRPRVSVPLIFFVCICQLLWSTVDKRSVSVSNFLNPASNVGEIIPFEIGSDSIDAEWFFIYQLGRHNESL